VRDQLNPEGSTDGDLYIEPERVWPECTCCLVVCDA